MGKIVNYLKAVWLGFISLPILLVIFQFIARELYLSRFGILITLYKGQPIAINYIIRWLLLIEPESMQGANFWAVLAVWGIGWFFVADWVRDFRATMTGIFLTYLLYIIYLSLYHHYPVVLYFPENFYQVFMGVIVSALALLHRKRMGRITFFDKLKRAGIEVPEAYRVDIKIPLKCGRCGALLLSNTKYCWKCGKDLEETLYS